MCSRTGFHIAAAVAYLAASGAMAAEYSSIKPLMLEAIDAPGGTAKGVIAGPIADKFAATTGSRSPVVVEVATLKSYQQEGCKRLNVRLKQAGVQTKDGKSAEFGIDYGVNLCRDGSPPTEGMDLEQVGKVLEANTGRGSGKGGK